jgi:hypothetical protein
MRKRWVAAVLIAAVAGLTACGGGGGGGGGNNNAGNNGNTQQPSSGGNQTSPSAYPTIYGPSNQPTENTGAADTTVHRFTVPSIPGDNIVSGYGTYQKIGSLRLKVTMCAKQTGAAFAVGAVAVAYNSAGLTKNVGGTVLKGPGDTECGTITFLFYTAHLKVHDFIGGNNGYIKTTGPVLTLF